jgi:hypothetical protein
VSARDKGEWNWGVTKVDFSAHVGWGERGQFLTCGEEKSVQ